MLCSAIEAQDQQQGSTAAYPIPLEPPATPPSLSNQLSPKASRAAPQLMLPGLRMVDVHTSAKVDQVQVRCAGVFGVGFKS